MEKSTKLKLTSILFLIVITISCTLLSFTNAFNAFAEEKYIPQILDIRDMQKFRSNSALMIEQSKNNDAIIANKNIIETLGENNLKDLIKNDVEIFIADESENSNIIAIKPTLVNDNLVYEPLIGIGVNGISIEKQNIDYIDYATNKLHETDSRFKSNYKPRDCYGRMQVDLIANGKYTVANAVLELAIAYDQYQIDGGYYVRQGFVINSFIMPTPYNSSAFTVKEYTLTSQIDMLYAPGTSHKVTSHDGGKIGVAKYLESKINVGAEVGISNGGVAGKISSDFSLSLGSSYSYTLGTQEVLSANDWILSSNSRFYNNTTRVTLIGSDTENKNRTRSARVAHVFDTIALSSTRDLTYKISMGNIWVEGLAFAPDYEKKNQEKLEIVFTSKLPIGDRVFLMGTASQQNDGANDYMTNAQYLSTFRQVGTEYNFYESYGIVG